MPSLLPPADPRQPPASPLYVLRSQPFRVAGKSPHVDQIEPLENGRLKLSGDLQDEICLSARALDEGFAIAISDGTLVQGRVDNWVDKCRFSVAVEGAGIATISRAERGDVLDLAWKIEWISVAIACDMHCAEHREMPKTQRELSFAEAGKIAA